MEFIRLYVLYVAALISFLALYISHVCFVYHIFMLQGFKKKDGQAARRLGRTQAADCGPPKGRAV